jgi:hypothetical protein
LAPVSHLILAQFSRPDKFHAKHRKKVAHAGQPRQVEQMGHPGQAGQIA